MPTDSELKSAAERLRSIVPDERMWDEPAAQWSDIDKDLWVCAFGFVRHILAQRADDGELVTFDYAEEVLAGSEAFLYSSDGVLFVDIEVYEIEIKSRSQLHVISQLLTALGIQSGGDAG